MSDEMTHELRDVAKLPFLTAINWATTGMEMGDGPLRAVKLYLRMPGNPDEQELLIMIHPAAYSIVKESIAEHERLHPELEGTPHEKKASPT